MRYTTTLFYTLLIAATFQMCKEDVNLEPGKVQFAFTPNTQTTSGRSTEGLSGMQISIENSGGAKILTDHHIELLKSGNSFVTNTLELPPGDYSLTGFNILNSDNEIRFIASKPGSLPLNFSVSNNKLSNIDVEAIDATQHVAPEDALQNNQFSITVLAATESGTALTQAEAFILKGSDTLQMHSLDAKVNSIAFTENTDEIYTLIIGKDGYSRHTREFTYTQLKQELNNQPLTITLHPAFTMVAYGGEFQVSITGNQDAQINVDWGDGAQDTYMINNSYTDITHTYGQEGNYFISVTGALDKITEFYSFYGYGQMDRINLEQLTELYDLRIGLTRSPEIIDLSRNKKLANVNLAGCFQLETLRLPEDNQIIALTLDGPNKISTASVDDIIYKLHRSVSANNRRNGSLGMLFETGMETDQMVGPPSPAAMAQISELKNSYGWSVYPEQSQIQ